MLTHTWPQLAENVCVTITEQCEDDEFNARVVDFVDARRKYPFITGGIDPDPEDIITAVRTASLSQCHLVTSCTHIDTRARMHAHIHTGRLVPLLSPL